MNETVTERIGNVVDLESMRQDPRRAISPEAIVCLVCGRRLRQLTNTHLASHGLTSGEYKERFGYNPGRALMCLTLRDAYAARAVRVGLAGQIRWRPVVVEPELRRLGGTRPIRLEERLTRQELSWKARAAAARNALC